MTKAISLVPKVLLFVCICLFCRESFSKVQVFEAKLDDEGVKEVRERITPELYLFSADGKLKLRALGFDGTTSRDVIDVLTNDKTLYIELSVAQRDKKIAELQIVATENLKKYFKSKNIPRSKHVKMVSDQNAHIEKTFKLPLLSEKAIAKQIQNTELSAEKLSILSNDTDSYLLVTYSADWCEPCKLLSYELLTYFKEHEGSVNMNWVKLNRP
ncbi:hypothetical protein [Paraglaciecola sp.]|uniref:hypothetical protein n=1 Tax=Paraglaciecola sp. TaxID=1920173 RepID=UPI003EF22B83